jgi:methionyl aminopeptidase
MNKEKIFQAGKIAKEVREYINSLVKKDLLLLEIAEKIERKIEDLGGKPAFPVNLSRNEIAAHYTPSPKDETKAHGLLKIDFGVSIDGWTSDTALTIDLENSEKNKKLIETAENALENAIKIIKQNKEKTTLQEIGKSIQETIEKEKLNPIINLSGHSMEKNELHAGLTIPNIDNSQNIPLEEGLYAIEPFVTEGLGRVKDGKPSGIYCLIDSKSPRSPQARKILNYIEEEYSTLPFCTRWIVKKFGTSSQIFLNQLESNGNLHHFNQLVEISNSKVAQAEHTLFLENNSVEITT